MRIIRTILWLICVVALLAIGSVVALYFLVTPDSVQTRLQSSLNQLGLTIRANELPTVRVLPTISVSLPSGQLFDKENKLVAFYRSAQFTVSPWWLAFGQIHVDQLLIDGFSLKEVECPPPSQWLKEHSTEQTSLWENLTINAVEFNNSDLRLKYDEHVLNFQNLRATFSAPAPQMHTPVALSTQLQLLPENLLLDLQASLTLDLNLASEQISLENLSIQSNGTQQGLAFQTQLNSPLVQISPLNLYAKTAEVKMCGDPTIGDIALSVAELSINPERLQAPDLYIQINKGSGPQTLKLDLRSPVLFERSSGIANAEHLQGAVVLPGQSESIPLSGNMNIDWRKEFIQGELFARLHGAPMSIRGQSAGFDHPDIKGDVVFGRLQLSDFSVLKSLERAQSVFPLTSQIKEKTVEASVGNSSQAPASEETSSESSAETSDGSNDTIEQTDSNTTVVEDPTQNIGRTDSTLSESAPNSVSEETHPLEFLNHFDFDGTLVVGELATGPVKLTQLKSDMSVKNGILKLPKAKALTYDGKTELDVQLNDLAHWSVSYSGESVNLSALLNDAGGNSKMGGVVHLQAKLYGNGFTQKNLNGQIGFSASRARIFGLDLKRALSELKQFKTPTQKDEQFTETEHLGGVATIHDGLAEIENLTINFGDFVSRGQAKVDLAEQTLTGRLLGRDASNLALTFNLSGQWYSPRLSLDAEKVRADNHLSAPPKKETKDGRSGWDKLKNFFKDRF